MEKVFAAAPYAPNLALAGQGSRALLRAKNLVLKGTPPHWYLECYAGSRDVGENIPAATATGTMTTVANSRTVTGTGSVFLTELHLGQFVFLNNQLLVVRSIESDTSWTSGIAASANFTGAAVLPPVLFEVDRQRGTLIRGNVLRFDKATLLGVGAGTLRLNGATTSGTAFSVAARPRLAVFDPVTGNYSAAFTLGMSSATFTTATGGAGTKNLPVGNYVIAIAPYRSATGGFNQLSPLVLHATTVVNQLVTLNLPAMDTANGQDGWMIFVSLSGAIGTNTGARVLYQYRAYTATDLGGTGATTLNFDWTDAEVGRNPIAEFDNFAPPEAEFVLNLSGLPFYISCFGPRSGASQFGKSPGPRVVASKPLNVEAALLNIKTTPSPPETLLGAVSGPARILAYGAAGIYAVQSSGRDDAPLVCRTYLRVGVRGVYAATIAQGFLYAFSEVGLVRTAAEAEQGVANFDFALPVVSKQADWISEKVFTVHDPVNEAILCFHAADHLNAAGYWVTKVDVFSLRYSAWMPPIYLESQTDDMIVSGAAKVDNRVYFVAGGRGGTWRTYEFGGGGGSVDWYAAWDYDTFATEEQQELVDSVKVTGRGVASVQVFGAGVGKDIDPDALDSGTGALASVLLPTATQVQQSREYELNLPEMSLCTVRVSGTWAGTGAKDRIDKVVLHVNTVEGER